MVLKFRITTDHFERDLILFKVFLIWISRTLRMNETRELQTSSLDLSTCKLFRLPLAAFYASGLYAPQT